MPLRLVDLCGFRNYIYFIAVPERRMGGLSLRMPAQGDVRLYPKYREGYGNLGRVEGRAAPQRGMVEGEPAAPFDGGDRGVSTPRIPTRF
jgi:hypothetical protein